jgi:DNA repair ATPase RecN
MSEEDQTLITPQKDISSSSKKKRSLSVKAKTSSDEIGKYKADLAFEKQCNTELGRRNRSYVKLIEKYESHRQNVDSRLSQINSELKRLKETLIQTSDKGALLLTSLLLCL